MSTFVFKNLRRLFDKYAVARTKHDALVKSTTKIFSNFVAFSENPNFNNIAFRGGNDTTCVKTCKKGTKSGCTTRGKGKPTGNLSCKEVDRRLKALGVDAATASLCVKSAIQSGIIEITGEDKEELNQVLHSEEHNCGHTINVTLGDLLGQPDYGGDDYESGLQNATVKCKELVEEEDEDGNTVETMCGDLEEEDGRTYVSEICQGNYRFDCGKFHNHCTKCPGFGTCIGDYR